MKQLNTYRNSYVSYDVFETIAKTFPTQYRQAYFTQRGYGALNPLFHYLVNNPLKTKACPRDIGVYGTGNKFDLRFVVYDEAGLVFVKRLWALLERICSANATLVAEPQEIVLYVTVPTMTMMENAIIELMANID